jgi:hypothetical protein
MRGLKSVCHRTPARCLLFGPRVVNRLGRANLGEPQNGPAMSAF